MAMVASAFLNSSSSGLCSGTLRGSGRSMQDRVVAGEKARTANKKYLDGTRLRASPEYGDFNGMSILNDVKVAVIEVEPTGEYALVQQEEVGSAPNPDWVQAIGWIRAHTLTKTQRNHCHQPWACADSAGVVRVLWRLHRQGGRALHRRGSTLSVRRLSS